MNALTSRHITAARTLTITSGKTSFRLTEPGRKGFRAEQFRAIVLLFADHSESITITLEYAKAIPWGVNWTTGSHDLDIAIDHESEAEVIKIIIDASDLQEGDHQGDHITIRSVTAQVYTSSSRESVAAECSLDGIVLHRKGKIEILS